MSIYMTVYKCICMHEYMHVCMHVCIVCVYTCVKLCMHLCVYACMYLYMHVCIHVCIYVIFKLGFERYGGIVLVGRGNCRGGSCWGRGNVRSPFLPTTSSFLSNKGADNRFLTFLL